jgi:hypothetical protein
VESGGVLRFWYLIEAREACRDLNVGIHGDRRGISLGERHEPWDRFALAPVIASCARWLRVALQPGNTRWFLIWRPHRQ